MGDSDSWCTPPEVTLLLEDFFGGPVDLDPCSNETSIVYARVAFQRHGLIRSWRVTGRCSTVYMNEPYSQSGIWTGKSLAELDSGNVGELIRLTMMSTSASWWSKMCEFRMNPRILGLRRLKFISPFTGKQSMTCRFEPALIYFGRRQRRFTRTFARLARWQTWGR